MMVLSYNHVLLGIPVDCMGLGGASGINSNSNSNISDTPENELV